MKTVLCFGNEFVKDDSLALNLADELKVEGVRFVKCKGDDILDCDINKNTYIMDVAKGIKRARMINDINEIVSRKSLTAHDFDLSFFLRLMKKTKEIKRINIIALPEKGKKEDIKKDVIRMVTR